jgi:hypothetical protein
MARAARRSPVRTRVVQISRPTLLRIATNIILDPFLVHCDMAYVICLQRTSTRYLRSSHALMPWHECDESSIRITGIQNPCMNQLHRTDHFSSPHSVHPLARQSVLLPVTMPATRRVGPQGNPAFGSHTDPYPHRMTTNALCKLERERHPCLMVDA